MLKNNNVVRFTVFVDDAENSNRIPCLGSSSQQFPLIMGQIKKKDSIVNVFMLIKCFMLNCVKKPGSKPKL
jgi:hypothetical protein